MAKPNNSNQLNLDSNPTISIRPERIIPTVKEVTLNDSSTRRIDLYIKKLRDQEIVARTDNGPVVLWSGGDYDTHKDDSEAQFRTQLLAILNA